MSADLAEHRLRRRHRRRGPCRACRSRAALRAHGLTVALADRRADRGAAPSADPRHWDLRVYAISPGSAPFLHAHRRVAGAAVRAHRGDRGDATSTATPGATLDFSAYELGERALAWIVEERELRAALLRRRSTCRASTIVTARRRSSSLDVSTREAHADARATGAQRSPARLVVGADGLRSWVRAGGRHRRRCRSSYGQTGVVANFACERAHRGVARQWFRADGGVLAWLPLPGRRISIVWSAPDAHGRASCWRSPPTRSPRASPTRAATCSAR